MSANKFKFLVPFAGAVITAGSAYEIGRQQSQTAIEIAKIKANTAMELAKLDAKAQMDRLIVKGELDKTVLIETNKVIPNNTGTINSPLEYGELKDLIINFDFSNLPFETLVGITLFFGTVTSLICILFLGLYITIYKMDLPFENYYSGFMLKLVNFIKPYSDWFIIFYLTLLVTTQMILFILSLRLLS